MSDEGTITQPMIETLLARLNRLEASISETVNTAVQSVISQITIQLETRISESRTQLEAHINESRVRLETQIESLRSEMTAGFTAIGDEIAVVADDTRIARANQKGLLRRIEELEPKVS
jgi:type II secretory pathway predicted ATPase ExeA